MRDIKFKAFIDRTDGGVGDDGVGGRYEMFFELINVPFTRANGELHIFVGFCDDDILTLDDSREGFTLRGR